MAERETTLDQIVAWAMRGRRKRPATAKARPEQPAGGAKRINLALQGGGSHGAFTWGVLDHLLSDGRLAIDGVSGTSAGAVNAVLLADGLARNDPEAARTGLAAFWRAASLGGSLPALQRGVISRLFSVMPTEGLPVQAWLGAWSRMFAPQDLNPLNINPLKDLIERFVDFEAIRAAGNLQLYIAATDVETGGLRIFAREEINAEVVMASACLPFLFRAVEIDGVPYWDGGYVGNPVIHPFLTGTAAQDVLVVQINPLTRPKVPASAREIVDRVNEITFNASLGAELRTIDLVNGLIDSGKLARGTGPGEFRRINLHRIVLEGVAANFDASSKLKTDYAFFSTMHKLGERAARRFLDAHFDDIGVRSSIDLKAEIAAERG